MLFSTWWQPLLSLWAIFWRIHFLSVLIIKWAAPCKNYVFGACGKWRPRSACTSMQFNKDFHCLLVESLDTTDIMNRDKLNLRILCTLEEIFRLTLLKKFSLVFHCGWNYIGSVLYPNYVIAEWFMYPKPSHFRSHIFKSFCSQKRLIVVTSFRWNRLIAHFRNCRISDSSYIWSIFYRNHLIVEDVLYANFLYLNCLIAETFLYPKHLISENELYPNHLIFEIILYPNQSSYSKTITNTNV